MPINPSTINFNCTRCGNCCGGGVPGFVSISDSEASLLAAFFKISIREFERKYCRRISYNNKLRSLCLKEKSNYDCIFFDSTGSTGCEIYELRPAQCKTWPFWEHNLSSQEIWNEVTSECPGCKKVGAA